MRSPRAAALLVAVAIVLTGCTGKDDKPDKPAAGQTPSITEGSPTSSPDASTSATPSPTPLPDIPDAFLPTSLVPGLNATWEWQDGTSGDGGGKPFGVCARADLGSIGAEKVGERTYFPPDDSDDLAAQQVARFSDTKSAGQAWAVLESWRSKCAAKIGAARSPKVSAEMSVKLPDKTLGRWYLVSWNPAGEETGRFEALGMARQGAVITVLRITNSGQDHNYEPDQEPMVRMLQQASLRLFAGLGDAPD